MNAIIGQVELSAEERELFKRVESEKPRGPKKLILSPTDWCNLRCRTCWRLDKEINPNSYRDEELKFPEIAQVLEDAREMGVQELDLTGGGEPFSREDMLEILSLAKDMGFWVTLTTNGTLLDEEKLRVLLALGLDDITFSFDGSTAEVNDEIRGEGVFERALAALRRLQQLKREGGFEAPVVRIAFVITAYNYFDIPELVEFAARHSVPAIQFSTLLEWDSNAHLSMSHAAAHNSLLDRLSGRNQPDPQESLREGMRLAEKHEIYTNLKPILTHGFFEHKTPNFCFAPWEMLFINSRGEALACCILASFYENELGNVRDISLKGLWNSEKMQAFRKQMKERNFFRGCRRCLPDFVDRFDALEEKFKYVR